MVTSINNSLTSELWHQIEAFKFDTPTTQRTFAEKLSSENAWTEDYTKRVLVEYKRFIFLLATSNVILSPSDAVDQAWHLHLTFTENYWIAL